MLNELGAMMILGKDTSHDIVLTREIRDRQTRVGRVTDTCQGLTLELIVRMRLFLVSFLRIIMVLSTYKMVLKLNLAQGKSFISN